MTDNIEKIFPLSPTQQGMLFHSLYAPGDAVYHNQIHYRIDGALDADAFQRAWQTVVDRHPAMRTLFTWERRERPLQVVNKSARLPWHFEDWRGLAERDQQARLQQVLADDRAKGFDLAKSPLFRASLYRLADNSYEFVCSHHHLILDGWSSVLLTREVLQAYEGGAVPALPPPFEKYVAWLREQDADSAKAFWKHELAEVSSSTRLPGSDASESAAATGYGEVAFDLPKETTLALRGFVRQQHLTLNSLIQGAWSLLLGRASGEESIVFGATVSGRPAGLDDVDRMIGCFINTLPVRVRVNDDQELVPWLRDLMLRQVERERFSYCGLSDIQRWIEFPPKTSLFDSIVVVENHTPDGNASGAAPKLRVGAMHALERTNFPLSLIVEAGEQVRLKLLYHQPQFNDASASRLLDRLAAALGSMASGSANRLRDVAQLSANEAGEVQAMSRGVSVDMPAVSLHQLIERQVELTPDACALITPDDPYAAAAQLTYRQFNSRANQLARVLRRRGVGADVPVGVMLERSADLVIALHAVLKAGGAYVPLDPDLPARRLAEMLEDCPVATVITHQSLAGKLPAHVRDFICVDAERSTIAAESADNLEAVSSSDSLAYVIFTSGSTGRPKGAMNTHRAIVNRLIWMQDAYALDGSDRVLQKTPYSFDVSVWEFFWSFLAGATLVVARPGGHRDPGYLANVIRAHHVTTLHFVPSMLRAFLADLDGSCESLRRVVCSGEALPFDLQQSLLARIPNTDLHNLYGPTEAAVDVTEWTCADGRDAGGVPIGRPIHNTDIHLLDAHLQPVAVGVPGDLMIGGVGLARGYAGRASLTADRFVADPLATTRGGRLYRTGDLARWRADGAIEYLGRSDHQLKIRGVRIEAAEIEALLLEHPDVRETAVIARPGPDGDLRLIAYVVPKAAAPSGADLRGFLEARLPDAMVPSAFELLDAMPLTASGKLDRKALPDPASHRPAMRTEYVAPRNVEEELLAEIWSDVLGRDRVGIYDDYFDLGGDSIRSISIISRARKIGLELTLQQVFELRTIDAMARARRQGSDGTQPRERLAPFGLISEADRSRLPAHIEDAYPLAALQAGMLYHALMTPDAAMYHNVSTYHLRARFDEQALLEALTRVADRHPILRTEFDLATYSEALQLVRREISIPLPVDDITTLSDADQRAAVAQLFEEEKRHSFDATKAPLWRFRVQIRSANTFQLTLTEHHAIVDGWSVASMVSEVLQQYYVQLGLSEAALPPAPSMTYAEFVAEERRAIGSTESREFWRDQLRGLVPAELKGVVAAYPSSVDPQPLVHAHVTPEISAGLKKVAKKAGVPLKSVLLGIHMRALQSLVGERRLATGLVSNGRLEATDGDRVLGLFLNTAPFVMDLPGGKWIDLFRSVFHHELSMLPHRRFPLAEVQRELGGIAPIDTTFNFMHFHAYADALALRGLDVIDATFYEKANFALAAEFGLDPKSGQLQLAFDYDPARLTDTQVAAIAASYVELMTAAVEDSARSYGDRSIVPASDRRQLLEEWNATAIDVSSAAVHELLEAHATADPDRAAVICGAALVSYGELNTRANQLAHHLRAIGVGPDVRVAVCIERSIDMVVGLLAVLKAGGAYIPLDPAWPRERLRMIHEDARPHALISRTSERDLLPDFAGQIVLMDRDAAALRTQPIENLSTVAAPSNLAYVIYTSGSTGRPKGVAVTHASLTNFLRSMSVTPGLDRNDTLLAVTTISFDIAGLELYLPLVCGAKLVIATREEAADGSRLKTMIDDYGVTVMQATPSTWRLLIAAGWTRQHSIKMLCGGEALPRPLASDLLDRGELWNVYGPTETTIWSTAYLVDADVRATDKSEQAVSIGRPIGNTQAYVIDSHVQPVPVGYRGGLFLGGDGLARGYLSRPSLTAMAFVPDPFRGVAGARMYRTGDVAAYQRDGSLLFVGRSDHQVKLRGYRIELGEIEAVLAAHPAVREAAVVIHKEGEGQERLVAYLVNDATIASPTREELRAHVEHTLPEYMVPTVWVTLPSLPHTPNGKVNRLALPAPKEARLAPRAARTLPRDESERLVAQAWKESLQVDDLGVDDNFFDVGGHSLLLIRVHEKLRRQFAAPIQLVDLFRLPTIRAQAQFLAEAMPMAASTANTQDRGDRQRAGFQKMSRLAATRRPSS